MSALREFKRWTKGEYVQLALFNVHYSANLGDGILSHCLAKEVETRNPDVQVRICDLAGRTSVGAGVARRKAVNAVLAKLPFNARRMVFSVLLGREVDRRLRPVWRRVLEEADVAVLGGGNLLSDIDLNFPLKIAGMGQELAFAGTPWAIYGVGVANNWSARGKELFSSAYRNHPPALVTVRDQRSKQLWDSATKGTNIVDAVVCADPAVLACDHFPASSPNRGGAKVLGLNVMDPEEINLHVARGFVDEASLTSWWRQLATIAVNAGYEVRFFTNGLLQDEEYLRRLMKSLEKENLLNEKLRIADCPKNPHELVGIIASCDVLAGYRMHTHIPAFSFQKPSVALTWDDKVNRFFKSVERSAYVLDPSAELPVAAFETIRQAEREGVAPEVWQRTLQSAREQIGQMVTRLKCSSAE